MSKEQKKKKSVSKKGYTFVKSYKEISEYRLDNGLSVLYKHMEGTGVVTTNLTYRVGSRNEVVGETGLAHMLEHMLFKPTTHDLKRKVDSGAMQFERETGCILNATTWKDRTTYFFSYPKEYFARALQIEAERMHDVVLSDKEFIPERGNVLSEFDMYFGDPYFALNFEMVSSAFHSHPYGHETIGFREDIERYTVEKLDAFYKKHYDPHNATLVIVGDISKNDALNETVRFFGRLATRGEAAKPPLVIEPKQEGVRRVEIRRDAVSNVVALAVKHGGFPSKDWYTTMLLSAILTDGPDSVLYNKLVDTGLASKVDMSVEPTQDPNAAFLYITLSKKAKHETMEKLVMKIISELTPKNIALHYKKVQQKILTEELIGRESSLKVALELTEYVSAGAWEKYFDTEAIIKDITAKDIVQKAHELFDLKTMTVGYFIGKQ